MFLTRATVGVPHLAVLVRDIEAPGLMQRGKALRHHSGAGREGANANFVARPPAEGEPWPIRTYERGVEAETLACGTGTVAVAASLAKLFRDGELGPHFDARDLWLHSCVTASTARIIAKSNRKNAVDEAFLAGLVHDVGVLVELQHDRATFAEAVKRSAAGRDLRECERECLGNDHEGFGAALCEYWKFPSSLVWVAGHHHDPVSVPAANRDLPMIVHVADRIAAEVAGGFTLDLQSGGIAPEALECLGLDPLSLEAIRAQAAIVAREGGELLAAA